MNDQDKTIADVNAELERLRKRIAELESRPVGGGCPEDLRENILRQNAILDNIPEIAWLKDRDSRYIAVNGPFGEACGVAPADLVGKTDYDIWPRDMAEGYRADDAEVMRTGQRKRVEERLIGPDNRESWIETIKTPIVDKQGNVIGTTGIARDITERKRGEKVLQESEARYRALFETMAQGAVYHASDGRIISANPAAERILGVSIDQMQGRTSMDPRWRAIHEDGSDFPGDRHPAMETLRTGKPVHGVAMGVFHPLRDEYRWILVDAVPEFLPGETAPYQVYATFTDITERRKAEGALYLKNYVFDVSIAANSIADPHGVITQANQAFLAIWGYSRKEEVVGKKIPEFLQNADEAEAIIAALNNTGKWEGNYTARKKDGSTFTAFGLATVLKDEQGTMIGYQSSVLDVTERKQAEADLRNRTHALATLLDVSRSLAESLDVGTVLQATTDGITRLSGLDTSAVYLLEEDTLRLGATTPPLPPQFPEELRNAPLKDHPHIREAITSGRPLFVPDLKAVELTSAEQAVVEQRGLRTALYLPLIAEEKAVGILIVNSVKKTREWHETINDLCRTFANLAALAVENARLYTSGRQYAADLEYQIAERKKAEQERLELERRLLHAQKLESLGILAGGIAHDFNNLLMAVLGNLDLALRSLSPVSPARANIEQSAQAARRATDLTRQMLAYSGKGRFIMKAMDLSEMVEENAHLFRSSVARTTTLDLRLERTLPPIEADAGQVQQVIMNLITNASEAIGEGAGRITITTGVRDCDAQCLKRNRIEDAPPAGRFVMLEVSDTGCGMDEQTQQRLFDPFFSTKATGRGLGMSAILGIVRGHRGAVFVESGVGRGSTIRILFPALAEARAVKDAAAGGHAAGAGTSALSGMVLVVDDEEMVRNVCKAMVQSFGMQVLTASDGREAVEVFRQNADGIGLVILDLTMPNMDGMTAFEELVRIRPGVKVVLSSGYNEQDSIQRMSATGLAGFIQKPYTMTGLREALEKAGKTGG